MNLKRSGFFFFLVLTLIPAGLFGDLLSQTPSMKEFGAGAEKLVVYTDVPGHEKPVLKAYSPRAKSDLYEIRVRSAATKNEWVQVFAHMTQNRALEMAEDGRNQTPTSRHGYQLATKGWTHTYANIEMTEGSVVEVEIRRIGNTLINGSALIVKSDLHPGQKVVPGSKKVEGGRVTFKISNPAQIVIDINGQMDDHNAAFPSGTPGGALPGNPPIHTVAFYANPILPRPNPTDGGVRFVKAGDAVPEQGDFHTLLFGPGVHKIGHGFRIRPGKTYFIPGDTILYGNLVNDGVDPGEFRSSGDRIRIMGYGKVCGVTIPHYQNRKSNAEYPEWDESTNGAQTNGIVPGQSSVGIVIRNAWDITIWGVTTDDPANFNYRVDRWDKRTNDQSLMRWTKMHSWRVNGDGCGGYIPIEDSFFRTSDDSTYVRYFRRRCTFWKDSNANQFRFVNFVSGGVEDCDILYSRWRDPNGVGCVFEFPPSLGAKPGEKREMNILIRNTRFHDRLPNPKHFINIDAVNTLTGLVFENISFYKPLNGRKSVIKGAAETPYTGSVMFKNVTFRNGLEDSAPVRLTRDNFRDYFEAHESFDASIFEP